VTQMKDNLLPMGVMVVECEDFRVGDILSCAHRVKILRLLGNIDVRTRLALLHKWAT
jgi:hypothetical protein